EVTPSSYATCMAFMASFSSDPPHIQPPAAQAPKAIADKFKSVFSRFLYSMLCLNDDYQLRLNPAKKDLLAAGLKYLAPKAFKSLPRLYLSFRRLSEPIYVF